MLLATRSSGAFWNSLPVCRALTFSSSLYLDSALILSSLNSWYFCLLSNTLYCLSNSFFDNFLEPNYEVGDTPFSPSSATGMRPLSTELPKPRGLVGILILNVTFYCLSSREGDLDLGFIGITKPAPGFWGETKLLCLLRLFLWSWPRSTDFMWLLLPLDT